MAAPITSNCAHFHTSRLPRFPAPAQPTPIIPHNTGTNTNTSALNTNQQRQHIQQGLALSILVATGVLRVRDEFTTYTAADVAEGLQDFLICIEMFAAALAHAYAFPPR